MAILQNSINANSTTPLPVASGGSDNSSFTAYGTLVAGTTSTGAFASVSPGTSGQVLTSNGAGSYPTYQAASGGGLSWFVTTSLTNNLVANIGYFSAHPTAQLVFTLPASPSLGDTYEVCANTAGLGGWTIQYNSGQFIQLGTLASTTSTGQIYGTSTKGDWIRIVYDGTNFMASMVQGFADVI